MSNISQTYLIYGDPVPQRRHRHYKCGSFIKTYDPSHKEKERFRKALLFQRSHKLFDNEIIFIELTFGIAPGKSVTSKTKNSQLWGKYHSFSGDVDNFSKFVMDACNKILWYDDCQVVSLKATKIYSEKPFTKINIMAKHKIEFLKNNQILTCISPQELMEMAHGCKEFSNISLEQTSEDMEHDSEKTSTTANTLISFVKAHGKIIEKLSKHIHKWNL